MFFIVDGDLDWLKFYLHKCIICQIYYLYNFLRLIFYVLDLLMCHNFEHITIVNFFLPTSLFCCTLSNYDRVFHTRRRLKY